MKLKRLELAGIGSFADRLEIDFDTLSHAGLFLIEGPTGSGKSTILDAIVFALYGSVAGTSSDQGRLDSHLRTESPFVELDFDVAGRSYRVRRSPAHERAKKRGKGTTEVKASASLLERTAAGWTALGHRASEVGENVQRIIGLDKDQFASTVVLAQGEFSRFLDAGTGDRQQILERVFGTEFYKRVEEQLYVMRRQARARRDEVQGMVDQSIHECCGILDLDSDGEETALISAVDAEITGIMASTEALDERLRAAQADLARAEAAHEGAVRLVSDQARKRSHLAEREALAASEPQVAQWRQAVRDHDKAAVVAPVVEDQQLAREQADLARTRFRAAVARVVAAGEPPESGRQRLAEVVGLLGRLEAPVLAEQGLTRMRADIRDLMAGVKTAHDQMTSAQTRSEQTRAQLHEARSALAGIPDQSQRMADLALAVERLTERRSELDRAQQRQAELAAARDALLIAEQEHADAVERTRAIEAERRQSLAAALAADLVDGQPCLVCGSADHPHPAAAVVADGDLGAAQHAQQLAGVRVQEARTEVARLQGGLDQIDGHGDAATYAQVTGLLADSLDQQDAARRQHESRVGLQARVDELSETSRTDADAVRAFELAHQRAASELAEREASLAQAEQQVAAAREGFDSVAERVRVLAAARDALDAAESARTVCESADSALAQADSVLTRSLRQSGFADATAVRAVLLTGDERTRLAAEIREWDAGMARAEAVLAELADVDLEQVVDTAATAEVRDAAEALIGALRDDRSRLSDRLGRVHPRRTELGRRIEARAKVSDETEAVIRMADLATASRNEVIHRVRLSAFVLMRRFEDVVNAANDRLGAISEGRYQLLVVTRGLDARAAAGLDLTIYDARSDSARSTRSLSGGERFYVSLALALGLADVVRSESGGVELGTLFIDEGFGSLDAEVLEEVMDMLEQVRVGEDRVIGLISHVEALKQRIDPRISVMRDPLRPGVSSLAVHV